mmetsp:Transcript_77538/g.240193  ORF Transcript_77538/g.240193 Transcript_77538/m.240193 type:complete len:434 (-) Transcript_77538:59-1360(-)
MSRSGHEESAMDFVNFLAGADFSSAGSTPLAAHPSPVPGLPAPLLGPQAGSSVLPPPSLLEAPMLAGHPSPGMSLPMPSLGWTQPGSQDNTAARLAELTARAANIGLAARGLYSVPYGMEAIPPAADEVENQSEMRLLRVRRMVEVVAELENRGSPSIPVEIWKEVSVMLLDQIYEMRQTASIEEVLPDSRLQCLAEVIPKAMPGLEMLSVALQSPEVMTNLLRNPDVRTCIDRQVLSRMPKCQAYARARGGGSAEYDEVLIGLSTVLLEVAIAQPPSPLDTPGPPPVEVPVARLPLPAMAEQVSGGLCQQVPPRPNTLFHGLGLPGAASPGDDEILLQRQQQELQRQRLLHLVRKEHTSEFADQQDLARGPCGAGTSSRSWMGGSAASTGMSAGASAKPGTSSKASEGTGNATSPAVSGKPATIGGWLRRGT